MSRSSAIDPEAARYMGASSYAAARETALQLSRQVIRLLCQANPDPRLRLPPAAERRELCDQWGERLNTLLFTSSRAVIDDVFKAAATLHGLIPGADEVCFQLR